MAEPGAAEGGVKAAPSLQSVTEGCTLAGEDTVFPGSFPWLNYQGPVRKGRNGGTAGSENLPRGSLFLCCSHHLG